MYKIWLISSDGKRKLSNIKKTLDVRVARSSAKISCSHICEALCYICQLFHPVWLCPDVADFILTQIIMFQKAWFWYSMFCSILVQDHRGHGAAVCEKIIFAFTPTTILKSPLQLRAIIRLRNLCGASENLWGRAENIWKSSRVENLKCRAENILWNCWECLDKQEQYSFEQSIQIRVL